MADSQSVGPYVLVEPAGEGGQGSVWRAKDRRTGATVALKTLRHDATGTVELARFRREAQILSALVDPGLPACLDVLEHDGKPFALVMEFINGTSVNDLRRDRRMAPREVWALGRELARIVSVLHRKGLVHRDLKAANILLRQGWENGVSGSVVVVDLGIAKGTSRHATAHTEPGFVVGSAAYLAPEFLLGSAMSSDASMAADVFSLGVLLWLLLFDRHPTGLPLRSTVVNLIVAYEHGAVVEPEPAVLASVEKKVPGLVDVVRRCAAFEPSQRYPNAHAVHDALLGLRPSMGSTKLCLEPTPMSYNVAIHPRPVDAVHGKPCASPVLVVGNAPPSACIEPTLDASMSDTLATLRRQAVETEDGWLIPAEVAREFEAPPASASPASSVPHAAGPCNALVSKGPVDRRMLLLLAGIFAAMALAAGVLLFAYLLATGTINLHP
jgi:serine/threonine protein kinase